MEIHSYSNDLCVNVNDIGGNGAAFVAAGRKRRILFKWRGNGVAMWRNGVSAIVMTWPGLSMAVTVSICGVAIGVCAFLLWRSVAWRQCVGVCGVNAFVANDL